jgi:hypothetical protein
VWEANAKKKKKKTWANWWGNLQDREVRRASRGRVDHLSKVQEKAATDMRDRITRGGQQMAEVKVSGILATTDLGGDLTEVARRICFLFSDFFAGFSSFWVAPLEEKTEVGCGGKSL